MDTQQRPLITWAGRTLLATVLAASGLSSPATAQEDPETPRWRTGQVRFPGQNKPTTVTYEVKDGWAIFEGDILLGRVDAARTAAASPIRASPGTPTFVRQDSSAPWVTSMATAKMT